jgi:ubiquinone/menaquinone biosynthesis C-methylase UbiE
MSNTDLYDIPELYDLVMLPNAATEAFYAEEAGKRGGVVLELACGSGRFTIPLAQLGIKVVGSDISEAMLQRARAKATTVGVDIDFRQADMRDAVLPDQSVGLILIAANSLLHLHDIEDLRRCLQAARRQLTAGGALVFDVFVPSVQILARKPDERHLIGHFAHNRYGEIRLEETTDYNPSTQVNRATWFWSTTDRKDFLITRLHLRQLFPQEVPLLIEAAGLRLVARYGGFARDRFDQHSQRQLYVCEVV